MSQKLSILKVNTVQGSACFVYFHMKSNEDQILFLLDYACRYFLIFCIMLRERSTHELIAHVHLLRQLEQGGVDLETPNLAHESRLACISALYQTAVLV